jgi:hypothetical protein
MRDAGDAATICALSRRHVRSTARGRSAKGSSHLDPQSVEIVMNKVLKRLEADGWATH